MHGWKLVGLGLIGLMGTAAGAAAQPGIPTGAADAASAAPSVIGAAPRVTTIWDYLGCSYEAKERCIRRCCASPLGQMLNNMLRPFGAMTGGLVGPICPITPSAEDLKKLLEDPSKAGGAEAVAEKIKKSEAEAKARAAAVRYLGTVDCERFPDAKKALISSLRGDSNECVRLAAAQALGNGCCCNRDTIAALAITVAGTDDDGNPPEKCERVRDAARFALEHCINCFVEKERIKVDRDKPEGGSKPESGKTAAVEPGRVQPATYYANLEHKPMTSVVDDAKRVVAGSGQPAAGSYAPPAGDRSLFGLMSKAGAVKAESAKQPATSQGMTANGRLVPVDKRVMVPSAPAKESGFTAKLQEMFAPVRDSAPSPEAERKLFYFQSRK